MLTAIEGIIISETAYGETSKILNVITKQYGVIGVMSKGCRSLKSPLRSVSTKLTYGEFQLYYKKDKLSTLVSVDILEPFHEIKKDIKKISYASFLLELTDQILKQSYHEEIYNLLIAALKKIEENYDPMVITNIVELKYLDYLGVMPVFDTCCFCESLDKIITICAASGGYVCENCLTNQKLVHTKTLKLIRMFYYVDLSKVTQVEIAEDIKKQINTFLDEYYERYTGLYLKSKLFLQNLNKIY